VERLEAIGDEIWAAAEHAFYHANTVSFTRSQRGLGYPEGYTLLAIFGTEDPSIINAIPREEYIARVNAKKQDLELLPASKLEVAARRAERDARIGKYKLHAACSVAFPPEPQFWRAFFVHVSGCQPGKVGQQPTPVKSFSQYCREKKACEDCQKWVRKVAEGTASLEAPGAGWAPSRDQVLDVAAKVRAALPHIAFGGVELQVPVKSRSKTLEDKLMGLTTGQAVGAVKHALRQCNAVGLRGGHMDAAKYHGEFVPPFMAHLGLTDVKKVPPRRTLDAVYLAHKRKDTDVAVEPAPPPRSKRARRAPK
jgi:hypothetical protein